MKREYSKRRHLQPLLISSAVLLAILLVALRGTSYFVPGDPKEGMKLFFGKGCAKCHSVMGEGGKAAPDLARAPSGHLSASELVAGMWNHAPTMWEKMRQEKTEPPRFDDTEMSNLFAFLYSVRSLDEAGDADHGRQLLVEKRCLECHAIAGQGGRAGPDLRNWASFRNPVSWIQAMWNHAPAMQALMQSRGFAWPEFEKNDVADLIAYVRTQTTSSRSHVYLKPADPAAGRELFRRKGCVNCHGELGTAGGRAPQLGTRPLPRTLGQFAGLMWNHSPQMWASMKSQGIPRPKFSDTEMADLIAYLFAARYFEASGNSLRGSRVFEVKGCSSCHAQQRGGAAPPLSTWRGRVSPIAFATALWNHGPVMLKRMQTQQVPWPLFQSDEMVDLMEFLNQGTAEQPPPKGRNK